MAKGKNLRKTVRPLDGPPQSLPEASFAVLLDASDFAVMRSYESFGGEDYARYLTRVEADANSLVRQGFTVRFTVFDPVEFVRFCTEEGFDPDTTAARARYGGQPPVGGAVDFPGGSVEEALDVLRDRAWGEAVSALADSLMLGAALRKGDVERVLEEAARDSVRCLGRLWSGLGEGVHSMTLTVETERGPLELRTGVDQSAESAMSVSSSMGSWCGLLAAAHVLDATGRLLVRSCSHRDSPFSGRPAVVIRGWCLVAGLLRPMTGPEVTEACCADGRTGQPVVPEQGAEHRPGFSLAGA